MNMDSELLLGGKVTFVVGGKNRVFVKHPVDLIRFPEDARLRFIDRRGASGFVTKIWRGFVSSDR